VSILATETHQNSRLTAKHFTKPTAFQRIRGMDRGISNA
jgi:hypothetical protein